MNKNSGKLSLALASASFVKSIFFSFFGLNFFDYGESLHNAKRIIEGQILYKDIWAIFPPADNYFPALSLWLGKGLLSVRIGQSALLFLFVYFFTHFLNKYMKPKYVLITITTFLFINIYIHLFFYHLFFFIALYFVDRYLKNQEKNWLFFSGIFLGFGFLFRQDIGIIGLLTTGIGLFVFNLTNGREKKNLFKFLEESLFLIGGFMLILLPVLTWLLKEEVFNEFMRQSFVRAHQISFEFSSGFMLKKLFLNPISVSSIYMSYTYFFYVIYLLLYVFFVKHIFTSGYKRYFKKKFLLILILIYGLLQIPYAFSVIEYGHVSKAAVPALFLGSYLVHELTERKKDVQRISVFFFLPFLIFGITSHVWWISKHKVPYKSKKSIVYLLSESVSGTTQPSAKGLDETLNFIENKTKKGDYIFALPYHSMLYFLSDRNCPSRYNNLLPGYIGEEGEREIIRDIEQNNVKVIVYSAKNAPGSRLVSEYAPTLHKYIMNNFRITKINSDDWYLMERQSK